MYIQHLKKVSLTLLLCSLSLQAAHASDEESKEVIPATEEKIDIFKSLMKLEPQEFIALLQAKKINKNKIYPDSGMTLLDYAAYLKIEELATFVLEDENLNLSLRKYPNSQGQSTLYTPLFYPCVHDRFEIVKRIFNHKNFNLKAFNQLALVSTWDKSALHICTRHLKIRLLRFFLSPKCNFNPHIKTEEGKMPFDKEEVGILFFGEQKEEKIATVNTLPEEAKKGQVKFVQGMGLLYANKLVPLAVCLILLNYIH